MIAFGLSGRFGLGWLVFIATTLLLLCCACDEGGLMCVCEFN